MTDQYRFGEDAVMHLADPGEPGRPEDALGRRQFLRGIAATGLAVGTDGLLAACSSGSSPAAAPHVVHRAPRRGGNLKLGMTGGSSDDTIDPHMSLTYIDAGRLQALYSPLVQLNGQAKIEYVLAESITTRNGSPSEWVIRLRRGVTFHDGQELTAADVIFTFRRIINGHLSGATGLGPVDLAGLKALDRHTVLVPMKSRSAASWSSSRRSGSTSTSRRPASGRPSRTAPGRSGTRASRPASAACSPGTRTTSSLDCPTPTP
jgi:extracellular solute-binding protein (family 5)